MPCVTGKPAPKGEADKTEAGSSPAEKEAEVIRCTCKHIQAETEEQEMVDIPQTRRGAGKEVTGICWEG